MYLHTRNTVDSSLVVSSGDALASNVAQKQLISYIGFSWETIIVVHANFLLEI